MGIEIDDFDRAKSETLPSFDHVEAGLHTQLPGRRIGQRAISRVHRVVDGDGHRDDVSKREEGGNPRRRGHEGGIAQR